MTGFAYYPYFLQRGDFLAEIERDGGGVSETKTIKEIENYMKVNRNFQRSGDRVQSLGKNLLVAA